MRDYRKLPIEDLGLNSRAYNAVKNVLWNEENRGKNTVGELEDILPRWVANYGPVSIICPDCKGAGRNVGKACPTCGRIPLIKCVTCKGAGRIKPLPTLPRISVRGCGKKTLAEIREALESLINLSKKEQTDGSLDRC